MSRRVVNKLFQRLGTRAVFSRERHLSFIAASACSTKNEGDYLVSAMKTEFSSLAFDRSLWTIGAGN